MHDVLVVGDRMHDDTGSFTGTTGYYIDLTTELAATRRETLDGALPEAVEARSLIDQAKGVLVHVYRVSAGQAFRVLLWRSQETNTKLRVLAAKLIAALPELHVAPVNLRVEFDHLLLTVHERPPPPEGFTPSPAR